MVGNVCCVLSCKRNHEGNKECTFYSFPSGFSNKHQRLKWIAALNRKNNDGTPWTPGKHDRICSVHFVGNEKSHALLNPSYAPTLFLTDESEVEAEQSVDQQMSWFKNEGLEMDVDTRVDKVPVYCEVPDCFEYQTEDSELSFHLFPIDKILRKEWLKAIKKENWTPKPGSKICSKHFKPNLIQEFHSKPILEHSAVPSIFGKSADLYPYKNVDHHGDVKMPDKDTSKVDTILYYCEVPNCFEYLREDSEITFHAFPADKKLRKQWMKALQKDSLPYKATSRVCSKHFLPGLIKNSVLEPTAVPSIFQNLPVPQIKAAPEETCPYNTVTNVVDVQCCNVEKDSCSKVDDKPVSVFHCCDSSSHLCSLLIIKEQGCKIKELNAKIKQLNDNATLARIVREQQLKRIKHLEDENFKLMKAIGWITKRKNDNKKEPKKNKKSKTTNDGKDKSQVLSDNKKQETDFQFQHRDIKTYKRKKEKNFKAASKVDILHNYGKLEQRIRQEHGQSDKTLTASKIKSEPYEFDIDVFKEEPIYPETESIPEEDQRNQRILNLFL